MASVAVQGFVRWVDRHPYFLTWAHCWCVVFLCLVMLAVLSGLLRLWWDVPELSPMSLVWLGRIGDVGGWICMAIDGAALTFMPVLLKISGRGDLARKVFFSILLAILVTLALCFLFAPALFVVGMTIQDAYGKAGVTF